MEVPSTCTKHELDDDVRELIFEDEMREADGLIDEPRWDDMLQVLREQGVTTDDATLASLPFVIELDDSVAGVLKG